MSFSNIIKQKLINLYEQTQKIGQIEKSSNLFNFLDKYNFEPNIQEGMGKSMSSVSEKSLQEIWVEMNTSPLLFNNLDSIFLKKIENELDKKSGFYFIEEPPIQYHNILQNKEYINKIEKKAVEISKIYGLKNCYYILNPKANEVKNENNNGNEYKYFIEAMIGFEQLEKKLDLVQKTLNIQESKQVGNNILSIELNFNNTNMKGQYNSCNHTIILNDKENLPLLHEYIHFLDKTHAALLLTGKTTQELFENKEYNAEEIVKCFNMNNLTIMKSHGLIDSIKTYQFNKTFQNEIQHNDLIKSIFNHYKEIEFNGYKKQFKQELFKWLSQQNLEGGIIICKELFNIIDGKVLNSSVLKDNNHIHEQLKNCALLYGKYANDIKDNNFMLFSKALDNHIWTEENKHRFITSSKDNYYQSQKEMLARSIEKNMDNTMQDLTNRLSTPTLDIKTNQDILTMIKEWKLKIDVFIENKENKQQMISTNKILHNITNLSSFLNTNQNHINKLKLS